MNIIRNKLPEFNEIIKFRENNLRGLINKSDEQMALEKGIEFLVWKFIQVYAECVRKGLWMTPEGFWIKEAGWETCRQDLTREEFGGGALLNALEKKLDFRWVNVWELVQGPEERVEAGGTVRERSELEGVEILDFSIYNWAANMVFGRCRVLKGWTAVDNCRMLDAASKLLVALRPIGSQVFLS